MRRRLSNFKGIAVLLIPEVNSVRIFHGSTLLARFLLLPALLVPGLRGQSPTASDRATRPAIVGSIEKGKYSNPMIGFELQLDPACTFADEAQAIDWSTRFPQRLSLALRCGDKLVLLNSFPLYADEQVDLRRDAEVSLLGVIDGGGFKKLGRWQNQSAEGTEMLVQKLTRHGDSDQELGFYYAWMIRRRYVSILAVGPESSKAELSQAAGKLKIEPKSSQ